MEDRSQEIIAVAVFFLTLSWISVLLRIYVRVWMLKSFGLDDWLMLLTTLLFTGYLTCQLGGVAYGTGKHFSDITWENRVRALKFWYFCEAFYIGTTTMLKIALCVFLFRIAVNRIHIWILGFMMIGTGIFGVGYFFLVIFQCRPISDWWNVAPGGLDNCVDLKVIVGTTYAASVLTAIVDWTIGIIPFFIVKDLNMPKNRKVLVAGILAFAAIGSTATIVRIPYVHALGEPDDFLWATTDMAIWSTVEPGIGITAGCVATLRPLLRNFLHRIGMSDHSQPVDSVKLSYGRQKNGYYRNTDGSKLRSQSKTPVDPNTLRSLGYDDETDRIIHVNTTINITAEDADRASTMENIKLNHVLPKYGNPVTPPQASGTRAWEGF